MMNSIKEMLNISDSAALNAAITLGAFVVAAKLVDIVIVRVLKRIAARTRFELDDAIIDLLHRPVYYTIGLIGVGVASGFLFEAASGLYIKSVLYTIVVLLWLFASLKISGALVQSAFAREDETGLRSSVLPLVDNVLKVAIFGAGVALVLSIWKVNITPLLASAGIVGVAVAIAAKDTLSNLFGGVSVFMDRPFKVGDYIVLDQGERGEVVNIGLRSTRIETRDHIQIIVPNSIIASSKVINESAPVPSFRVRVSIGVAYGTDIDLLEEALLRIARENPNILPEPEPRVRFRRFGDSALEFELLCWAAEPAKRGLTIHEINVAIYKRLPELNITIPFPQRDVHIKGPAGSGTTG